ncbi:MULTISPECIES: hypothetical protein [unclassified Bradyrhizobium]|uniref:hypothetical protein n=1 Tax=unclassified Bradyrhizobium TaxID=2631580 RepID=UPI001FF80508|nr:MULTISPECIES: hypothetical protein [unclassified Bradyrhizobium]
MAIVPDHLHKIASATAEDEQMTAERVLAQHLLHLMLQDRRKRRTDIKPDLLNTLGFLRVAPIGSDMAIKLERMRTLVL